MYEIFEKLLQEKGITAYKVSKETGIPTSSFTDWKKKRSKPKFINLKKIADYLDVEVNYLMGEDNIRAKKQEEKEHMVQIPLYAQIGCDRGELDTKKIVEYIGMPKLLLNSNKEYFAFYTNSNDLSIFEKTNILENGQIGCFCIDNNDTVFKKFYKTKQGLIMLQNDKDDTDDPIAVTPENNSFKVLGKLALTVSKTNY